MLRLLLDQDFDHRIIWGLVDRMPDLDYTTAHALGLRKTDDRKLLLRAAIEGRVLLSHDERTMPGHYFALSNRGESLQGVFIVPRRIGIGAAVENLDIIIQCSTHADWMNEYKVLPF